ncbi:hypothetical protein CEUSTIGMA_g6712.t1 [Chlamydomonas eustigma]|uniref:Uncharacterized protein n=1 Tax=Chlamydomonas eustigma TaxID=1157962 RepID=A0A250X8Q8_9CHLO|nr:hypothetical protein CEUSTIGMA_g6712.t1 [Chlamydomonas eustigma]|eukprot:GAX79272.1 hypothetical protein CEUSTIGMA_g6712.t1 [Chlamydomonas eustigma]
MHWPLVVLCTSFIAQLQVSRCGNITFATFPVSVLKSSARLKLSAITRPQNNSGTNEDKHHQENFKRFPDNLTLVHNNATDPSTHAINTHNLKQQALQNEGTISPHVFRQVSNVRSLFEEQGAMQGGISSSSDLQYSRYLPDEDSLVGKPGGLHNTMKINGQQSYALTTQQLLGKPMCRQLTFNDNLTGRIYQDPLTGHYMYEPDACRLRRLSAQHTLQCLKGMEVVFVGDSVTRYQYTSLIHFLAAGGYQNPYDDGHHSVSSVSHWDRNYPMLYKGVPSLVNKHMNKNGLLGSATCDKCDKAKSMEEWRFRVKKKGQSSNSTIKIDYKYVYKYPTFHDAGMNALRWAVMGRQSAGSVIEASGTNVDQNLVGRALGQIEENAEESLAERSGERVELARHLMRMLRDRNTLKGEEDAALLGMKRTLVSDNGHRVGAGEERGSSNRRVARHSVASNDARDLSDAASSVATTATSLAGAHPPDIVVLNMCAWWDQKKPGSELVEEMRSKVVGRCLRAVVVMLIGVLGGCAWFGSPALWIRLTTTKCLLVLMPWLVNMDGRS